MLSRILTANQPQRYLPIPQKRPQSLLVTLKGRSHRGLEIGIVQMPIAFPADQPRLRNARLIPAVPVIELRALQPSLLRPGSGSA